MPEDIDGPGSNFWDFLQTFFSKPEVIKTTFGMGLLTIVVVLIATGHLDGHMLVQWFKDVWHTIKGTG